MRRNARKTGAEQEGIPLDLNLTVIREELEPEFDLRTQRIIPSYRFDNVKYDVGRRQLSEHTLYVLDAEQLGSFMRRVGDKKCSAIIIGEYIEELPHIASMLSFISLAEDRSDCAIEALTVVQEFLDQAQRWEKQLQAMRGCHYKLAEFLKVGYELIRNPMILYNSAYLIVATTQGIHEEPKDMAWKSLVSAGYWTPEIRSAVRTEQFSGRRNRATYYDTNKFEHNGVVVSFFDGSNSVGILFVQEYFSAITEREMFLIQFFSEIVRQELMDQSQARPDGSTVVDSFIRTVLQSDTVLFAESFVDYHLQQLGWKNRATYHVLTFTDMFKGDRNRYVPEYIYNLFPECYCLEMDEHLVAVVQADEADLEEKTGKLVEVIRESFMKCGISNALACFLEVGFGYRESQAALSMGEIMSPTFWFYRYKDYSMEYLVSFALRSETLEVLCHPAILRLAAEDEENNSQYISTLEAYLEGGNNLSKLAVAMHVHRNTLQYRLNRIQEISGIDYHDEKEMKKLYFSIKLLYVHRKMQQKKVNELPKNEENS